MITEHVQMVVDSILHILHDLVCVFVGVRACMCVCCSHGHAHLISFSSPFILKNLHMIDLDSHIWWLWNFIFFLFPAKVIGAFDRHGWRRVENRHGPCNLNNTTKKTNL